VILLEDGDFMSDKMNLDDFLDNIDFKPLNKGLGFHHGKKSNSFEELTLREKSELLKEDLERVAKPKSEAQVIIFKKLKVYIHNLRTWEIWLHFMLMKRT
jgi:hypothetical protein